MCILLPLRLDAIRDKYHAALGAGDCSSDSDEIVFRIDLYDGEVLNRDVLSAHVARKPLALKDPRRRRARAVGAGVTRNRTGTVRLLEAVVAEPLDGAGVALALGNARNVDRVADGECIGLDDVADAQSRAVVEPKFTQHALERDARLGEMALERFVDGLFGDVAETELHGFIAVVFGCLLLYDNARAGLNDRHGDHFAAFVKKLRHADFLAYDALLHTFLYLLSGASQAVGIRDALDQVIPVNTVLGEFTSK